MALVMEIGHPCDWNCNTLQFLVKVHSEEKNVAFLHTRQIHELRKGKSMALLQIVTNSLNMNSFHIFSGHVWKPNLCSAVFNYFH